VKLGAYTLKKEKPHTLRDVWGGGYSEWKIADYGMMVMASFELALSAPEASTAVVTKK
jgi:hypothetical protein